MKMKTNSVLSLAVVAVSLAGIVLAPVVSAASTTTINAVVAKSAAVATTSGTVTINITPTSAGSYSNASDTVTAGTNSATGYQLQISAATPALTNGGSTIAALGTATPVAPAALTVNKWGYRVDNASGFGAGTTTTQTNAASLSGTWAGITATPTTFKTTSAAANSDSTTVWYGVGSDFTNPNGTYTTTVTYTAVAN